MDPKSPFIAALCAVVVGGCTSLTPYFDQQVGRAVDMAKARQTVNPDASRNTDPVAGIGGGPADASMDEYQKSFTAPPPTFTVINIGGG
jgi:hypothetical protein